MPTAKRLRSSTIRILARPPSARVCSKACLAVHILPAVSQATINRSCTSMRGRSACEPPLDAMRQAADEEAAQGRRPPKRGSGQTRRSIVGTQRSSKSCRESSQIGGGRTSGISSSLSIRSLFGGLRTDEQADRSCSEMLGRTKRSPMMRCADPKWWLHLLIRL
jgi:hypothetical protein